jgi:CheY-like chemotaxis protein
MATVLVVDDEFGIGELLEALFQDDGHRVMTAMNGRHALERMAESRPDLVISDLMMPVMDGGVFLRTLRAHEDFRDIPFVLMCALPESGVVDRIQGYDAYLPKPFKLAAVSDLAARLLNGR